MSTTVVHVKDKNYDIYIGRAVPRRGVPRSIWANPFKIDAEHDREAVIELYSAWLNTQPALLARIPDLVGLRLGCWCAPEPCHGDILAERANRFALVLDLQDQLTP